MLSYFSPPDEDLPRGDPVDEGRDGASRTQDKSTGCTRDSMEKKLYSMKQDSGYNKTMRVV